MGNIFKSIKLFTLISIIALSLASCGDPEPRDRTEGANSPTGGAGTSQIRGYLCYYTSTSIPGNGGSQFMKYTHFDGSGNIKYWEEYISTGSGGGYGASHPSAVGTYTVQGDKIIIKSNGQTYEATVNYRRGGIISEFYFGGELYGTDLCN